MIAEYKVLARLTLTKYLIWIGRWTNATSEWLRDVSNSSSRTRISETTFLRHKRPEISTIMTMNMERKQLTLLWNDCRGGVSFLGLRTGVLIVGCCRESTVIIIIDRLASSRYRCNRISWWDIRTIWCGVSCFCRCKDGSCGILNGWDLNTTVDRRHADTCCERYKLCKNTYIYLTIGQIIIKIINHPLRLRIQAIHRKNCWNRCRL